MIWSSHPFNGDFHAQSPSQTDEREAGKKKDGRVLQSSGTYPRSFQTLLHQAFSILQPRKGTKCSGGAERTPAASGSRRKLTPSPAGFSLLLPHFQDTSSVSRMREACSYGHIESLSRSYTLLLFISHAVSNPTKIAGSNPADPTTSEGPARAPRCGSSLGPDLHSKLVKSHQAGFD